MLGKIKKLGSRSVVVFAVGWCCATAWPAETEAGNKPFNVLFIAVDDLNDWVGFLGGNPDSKTPHMDRFAQQGLTFVNAQCPAPACIPSRCALMTGRTPARSGMYSNAAGYFRNYPDLADQVTIPQYFSRNGYVSFGVGKILHTVDKVDWDVQGDRVHYSKNPLPKGFSFKNKKMPRTEKLIQACLPLDVDASEMTDWKNAEWTVAQLKRKHDKPFFLACGIYRPHLPWHVPEKYYGLFPLDQITLPEVKENDLDDTGFNHPEGNVKFMMENERVWRKNVQAYLACISFADDCVGQILNALEKSEYRDNTIVVLWSDHGWHLGEKIHWKKFVLWEESARCILNFRVPGMTQSGSRCSAPVNLQDIYPTLIELCHLPAKLVDGASLVPFLKDPSAKRQDPSITANEWGFSARSEKWRYIWYKKSGFEELYDHSKDPNEWTNLANNPEYAAIKKSLKRAVPKEFSPVKRSGEAAGKPMRGK